MASYEIPLRCVLDGDAKPLPPLPLGPGRSRRPYRPALNSDSEQSLAPSHRGGIVFPPDLDMKVKDSEPDSESPVVTDHWQSRRTRPHHHSASSPASVPRSHLPMKGEWDTEPARSRHLRQKSDRPTRSYVRRGPPPAITTVDELSLPPKVRQIIGVQSQRKTEGAQWKPLLPQDAPAWTRRARPPTSTTSAYSLASGPQQDMLFHMEGIVETRQRAEDDDIDEINQRLESLMHSPGFAAIRCLPESRASGSRFPGSHDAPARADPPQDEPRQQDQRSSREMYHDLVVELAQSAPAALPPPAPRLPTGPDARPSGSSSLHHRRHQSSLSKETNQLRRGNGHASCPQLSRPRPNPPQISVFDNDSSDSEADSDSKPLWSPRLAILGRRRRH
jgi:hypothetical protein